MSRLSPTSPDEDAKLLALKRRVYPIAIAVAILGSWVGWLVPGFPDSSDPFDRFSLPIFALWLTVWEVVLWRWPSRLVWAERAAWLGAAALFLLNTYRNLQLPVLNQEYIWVSALWQGLVYLLAYPVFGAQLAWKVSSGFLALQALAGGLAVTPYLLAGATLNDSINSLVQFYLSQIGYLVTARLIVSYEERAVAMRSRAQALYELAHTDPLTQVANRRKLYAEISRELSRCLRDEKPLALILLDLDRFKPINDTHGHNVGDLVLYEVAQLLQAHLRPANRLGRWGGEEFLVLLPETDLSGAVAVAERLRQALSLEPIGPVGQVTASFGVAGARASDTPESLIARADQAMYAAKQAGGNRVEVARNEPIQKG